MRINMLLPAFALLLAASLPAQAQNDLLPDLTFDADAPLDNFVDTTRIPGRALFRFDTSLANLGPGDYLLLSTEVPVDADRELVNQVIQRDDDTTRERDAGNFVYNTSDFHMEADDWVSYRIREILPEDGVGMILRRGQKRSVRITSSTIYDGDIPGTPPFGQQVNAIFRRHGISIGWADLYTKNLDLQWIDITGLKQGEYWLEIMVDAGNFIEEANEDNNIARLKVMLTDPSQPTFETHRADSADFGVLDLGELLRIIQLYNAGGFTCSSDGSEDGFEIDGFSLDCQPHSSDYDPQDWEISLSELLRAIQIYSLGDYSACPGGGTEDGFCPGIPSAR